MSASCGVCVLYRWRSLSRADQSSRVDLTECGVSMISKPWRRGRLSSLVLLGYVNKWFYMLIANSLLCHWTGVLCANSQFVTVPLDRCFSYKA